MANYNKWFTWIAILGKHSFCIRRINCTRLCLVQLLSFQYLYNSCNYFPNCIQIHVITYTNSACDWVSWNFHYCIYSTQKELSIHTENSILIKYLLGGSGWWIILATQHNIEQLIHRNLMLGSWLSMVASYVCLHFYCHCRCTNTWLGMIQLDHMMLFTQSSFNYGRKEMSGEPFHHHL